MQKKKTRPNLKKKIQISQYPIFSKKNPIWHVCDEYIYCNIATVLLNSLFLFYSFNTTATMEQPSTPVPGSKLIKHSLEIISPSTPYKTPTEEKKPPLSARRKEKQKQEEEAAQPEAD